MTIGATALWDPWDASPPTLEITGTKCIWSPPTSADGCRFFCAGHRGKLIVLPRTSWQNLREKERKVGNGMGETLVEQ